MYAYHGHAVGGKRSPEYQSWADMIKRCYNSKRYEYKHYGGRGITVCERWRENFKYFLEDIGLKPNPKCTLDRIDVEKGYFPENCRWVDMTQQARNKRNNRILEYRGEKKCLSEWAQISGVKRTVLRARIDIYGWSIEKALETPSSRKFKNIMI